jgi:hypothetical protein
MRALQHPTAQTDRRRYQRHLLSGEILVELRVEVSGDAPAMLLTRGQVADISYGGLRCDIDFDVPAGTKVDVRFADSPRDALSPLALDGRVVRTISVGGVPEQVAIAFAQPLDHLDAEMLQQRDPGPSLRGRTAATRRASWADEPQGYPSFATGSLL